MKESQKFADVQAGSGAFRWAAVAVILVLAAACGTSSDQLPLSPDEESQIIALDIEGMT